MTPSEAALPERQAGPWEQAHSAMLPRLCQLHRDLATCAAFPLCAPDPTLASHPTPAPFPVLLTVEKKTHKRSGQECNV